jgi:hypothetical protein
MSPLDNIRKNHKGLNSKHCRINLLHLRNVYWSYIKEFCMYLAYLPCCCLGAVAGGRGQCRAVISRTVLPYCPTDPKNFETMFKIYNKHDHQN